MKGRQADEPREPDDQGGPSAAARLRGSVAIAMAMAVGLSTARFYLGLARPGVDPTALDLALYYTVIGPIVGLFYYYVAVALLERAVLWVAACGVAAYVFISWFAWPILVQRPAAMLGEAGSVAATAVRRSRLAAREEWLQSLIAARRYGEPGEPPPMLDVQPSDIGSAVAVRNTSDAEIVVALSRVTADAGASGGWRGCGYSGYAGEGAQEWVALSAGEEAVFELEPVCAEVYLDLESHDEFRVGNESLPVERGWWTTSALAAPDGRAKERASGSTALPSTYDARPFFGASRRRN